MKISKGFRFFTGDVNWLDIGSTAREFGRGDIQLAIVRGIDAGNPDATLIGKMYHNTGGNTIGGKVNIRPITDALARR